MKNNLLQIKKDTGNTNVDDSITISKLKLKAYLTFLKRDKDALIKVKEEFKIFMSDTLSNFMESTDTVCCVLHLSTSSTKNDYIGTKQNENVRRLAKQLKVNFENILSPLLVFFEHSHGNSSNKITSFKFFRKVFEAHFGLKSIVRDPNFSFVA